ncbi:hypothetical protein BC351_19915 [Paenibacillus ferrarius]|uniref:Uncharacterized protein n=1 Tax=Paenibacillus ferrarius TaxID=1469647 RepID=A0A1V4HP98_9BACL|nr:hypothetical protein BC351_19915 [Paenibacillus ferrarius]
MVANSVTRRLPCSRKRNLADICHLEFWVKRKLNPFLIFWGGGDPGKPNRASGKETVASYSTVSKRQAQAPKRNKPQQTRTEPAEKAVSVEEKPRTTPEPAKKAGSSSKKELTPGKPNRASRKSSLRRRKAANRP